MDKQMIELAHEIESALTLDADLVARAKKALDARTAAPVNEAAFDSTDNVLALVHELRRGWNVAIHGTARLPNGHWSCTLRRSAIRDNDAYIGIGAGPTLPHALLAALLKALSQAD